MPGRRKAAVRKVRRAAVKARRAGRNAGASVANGVRKAKSAYAKTSTRTKVAAAVTGAAAAAVAIVAAVRGRSKKKKKRGLLRK